MKNLELARINIITFLRIGIILFFLFILFLKRDLLFNQGYKLIRKSDYNKAIEIFSGYLITKPDNASYLYGIAHCYYMLGFNANSINYFEKLLKVKNKWGEVYFLLAILYMEERKDFNKASEYLKKVKDVQNKFIFVNKASFFQINEVEGWVLYKHGDIENAFKKYDLAVPYWNKYLKKVKKSFLERFSPVCYRIGVIFTQKGESKKAIEYYQRSIRFSPTSFFAIKSQEEIQKLSSK